MCRGITSSTRQASKASYVIEYDPIPYYHQQSKAIDIVSFFDNIERRLIVQVQQFVQVLGPIIKINLHSRIIIKSKLLAVLALRSVKKRFQKNEHQPSLYQFKTLRQLALRYKEATSELHQNVLSQMKAPSSCSSLTPRFLISSSR